MLLPSRFESPSILMGTYHSLANGDVPVYGKTDMLYKNFRVGKEGHKGYHRMSTNGGQDVGGPMDLIEYNIQGSPSGIVQVRSGAENLYGDHIYNGRIWIEPPRMWDFDLSYGQPPTDWGATAYSKMKPTKPNFEALNAVYELREVPEMLRQRFLPHLSTIGSAFLAYQFGWRALMNDVANFVMTHLSAQKRLAQLLRDNGRSVRRKIKLQSITSEPQVSEYFDNGAYSPGFVTYFYAGQAPVQKITYTKDTVWASARFRYWLPDGPQDVVYKRKLMAELFGLNPRPSVIYNAMPWTWLNDWFNNLGDIIDNLDAGVADRLAADYFYVMRRWDSIVDYSVDAQLYRYPDRKIITARAGSQWTVSRKTRVVGDPFGFATKSSPLSGMQLAILGALGLSRVS